MARILTVEQAAEKLQMSTRTTRDMLRLGKLPGRKIGRAWRVVDTDLERWIRAGQGTHTRPGSSVTSVFYSLARGGARQVCDVQAAIAAYWAKFVSGASSHILRSCSIASAPSCVHLMPACLRRAWARVLQADSTTPLPM